ncbi:unnamed protein product [Eruca vesicaria subsp. sativa]|uniref:J domain-containing protein n=1 Tax=Eruca vesicaria subsp. sativa TaxID=29727 RepID=A0ABC8KVW5_ERUVS|nr:unnamed protein product [Eruca vesicaria subsp. sativa]
MNIINREEALRAKDLAEGLMEKSDFTGARKLALKAQKMDPTLENITHMTMVCDVHCAATEKLFGNELDWYGILQIDMYSDDIVIKKQYRKLALLLHPDKNKLPGAESAFKLIGEAQRILLDKDKRSVYDIKRRAWRKPAPAPVYKTQQVPRNRAQQASVNLRNVYNDLRAKATPPAGFSHRPTFWTSCPFCRLRYEYGREHVMKETTCLGCRKQFTAFEIPCQSVPPAKNSSQTTSFPQQNKFPAQNACSEPPQHPDGPATVPSGKATTVPSGKATATGKMKRKRKYMDESSDSSDSESDDEFGDVVNGDTQGLRSNGGQQPRRSVRSKRQVSYKENLKEDDVDLVNEDGGESGKNIDTEKEEELEGEKQTHETLPNGITRKEKIEEDQVKLESEDSGNDSEEDLCSGSEAKPKVINCDDPEFSDFDKLRAESCFKAGQIWALYDDGEGMPRFYGLIKKATITPVFSVTYIWLESEEDEEERNLPVSVGKYELGGEEKTDNTEVFSHLVESKSRSRRYFKVFPKKGETWALFKNWNMDLSSGSSHEYEFVEILSDHTEGAAILVGFLSKVEGFKFVFCPVPKDGLDTGEIPPHEFCRFSHGIPSNRLKGTEGRGISEGWYELDPAALPVPGSPPS